MKKTFAVLLSLVMCLGLFAGCGGGGDGGSHTHTYATTWSSDETNHWHAATCEHTDEMSDLAAHTFGDWTVVTEQTCVQDGVQERACTVCGYTEEQTLPATGVHDYEVAVHIDGDCVTEERTSYKCKNCSDTYEEVGNVDPSVHHSTAFACGSHCASCAQDTAESDHAAAACGLSGHYICDGQDHIQCTIPVDENMIFEETADGTGMILTGFEAAGTETEILVPAYVDGKPVVEIADVFDGTLADIGAWMKTVTYVYIPDTVKTIGMYFVYQMDALEEIRLPKSVTSWAQHTFFDNPSLTELNIPRGVTTLSGNVGFSDPSSAEAAIETISVPSSFTDLDCLRLFFAAKADIAVNYEGTEEEWTALVDTVSDADLKAILTADTFEVTCEYDYAAQYTEESNALQLRISDFTFDFVDGGVAITGYVGDAVETLAIPATIGGIPVVALAQDALEVLVDGDGTVTANANLAFVKTFDFSAATNLTTIGNYNFYNLDALETVVLPDSVTYIGSQCFYDCPNLTAVTLPEGATMDMSNAPFAYCGNLTSVTLPATLEGTSNAGAFAVEGESARELSVSFPGSYTVFYLHTKDAAANLADAEIEYFGGAETVRDNGAEYLLCEDAEGNDYYTLVGFYDTVNSPEDGVTPVEAYTIPKTYNDIPIKAIGEAVLNSNAYANEDVANWLKTSLTAILLDGGTTETNIESIGNYNYVGLTAATQINQPDSIINETLVGCYVDLNASLYIRVPRGVKVLEDCFQWSGAYFGGAGGRWLVLPSSLEMFTGECWTGAYSAFGFVMDVSYDSANATLSTLLDNSPCTTAAWEGAIVPFFKTFNAAWLVHGAGGFFPSDPINNPTNLDTPMFSYDLFINLNY
ncbi:MAG TPA: leucine-rich repeat domain-containing protein [Candidatus Borkfalkia excrementigallinarum]|uniref:Leucine-rich repeat domain-containing protein n=1 Tax=Candidatus Borkfalkia excrementigallinarum TaxID=2838506 RepID=A0A9D2CRZ5_9FIRM|nr:leucine-rich repeat domain-containing protein [Candidatus Borkfalkia excrementigallinarum]